jgi:LacI family transcriptional regulator
LRTGKTNVIALVLSTETDVMNHTSRLLYSIAASLRGTSYHLVTMPFFPDQDPMDPIRYIVETGSADGVVINQTTPNDPRVIYLHENNFPFVTHGRTETGINHPYFDYDNEAFARVAVEELVRRGRTNLLLVAPPVQHAYSGHMSKGFLQTAQRLGVRATILQTATSDDSAQAVETAIIARLAQPDRPDGLLMGSTTSAMAAVSGAETLGLRIRDDFDIAAKEAIQFLQRFRPGIIVLQEDVGRAGIFLARAVIDAIEKSEPEMGQYLDSPREHFF